MIFESKIPYPNIEVETKNYSYATLLRKAYASETSEDTAIHLYLYQSIILEKEYLNISNILKRISVVEMKHLEILGELILLLGVKPIYSSPYKNGLSKYFNASYVKYNTNLQEILRINIEAETQAIYYYNYLTKVIKDKYIVNILKRIIVDEQIHLGIFNNLYKEYFK